MPPFDVLAALATSSTVAAWYPCVAKTSSAASRMRSWRTIARSCRTAATLPPQTDRSVGFQYARRGSQPDTPLAGADALGEAAHERRQRLAALDRHGVVDAGPNPADRPVAAQPDHALGLGLAHESGSQIGI